MEDCFKSIVPKSSYNLESPSEEKDQSKKISPLPIDSKEFLSISPFLNQTSDISDRFSEKIENPASDKASQISQNILSGKERKDQKTRMQQIVKNSLKNLEIKVKGSAFEKFKQRIRQRKFPILRSLWSAIKKPLKKLRDFFGKLKILFKAKKEISNQKIEITNSEEAMLKKLRESTLETDNENTLHYLMGMSVDSIVNKQAKKHGIKAGYIFKKGGYSHIVREHEKNACKEVLTKLEKEKKRLDLQENDYERNQLEEKQKIIEKYIGGFERTEKINKAIVNLKSKKKDQITPRTAVAKEIMLEASKLHDEDVMHLSLSNSNHAMRIAIHKDENQFRIRLYDSSGILENCKHNFISNVRRWWGGSSHSFTGMEIAIPTSEMQKQGVEYFSKLYEIETADYQQDEKDEKYYFNEIFERFRHFGEKKKVTFLPKSQEKQVTSNCYAKISQACQFHELGDHYKSIRTEELRQIKTDMFNILSKSEKDIKKNEVFFPYVTQKELADLETKKEKLLSDHEAKLFTEALEDCNEVPSVTHFEGLLKNRKMFEKYNKRYHAQHKNMLKREENKQIPIKELVPDHTDV